MLGAIFMATDYTTSPVTSKGRIIYGIGCGAITVFIRYYGGYPEGVSFAILIMNLFVWYLDKLTKPVNFGGAKKNGAK
jgi:electron transport complex protein RnfD